MPMKSSIGSEKAFHGRRFSVEMWVPLGATGAAFLADFSAFGQAIALKSLIADTKLSLAKVEVAGSNPVSRFHIPNAAEPQPNREDAFPPRAFSNQLSAPPHARQAKVDIGMVPECPSFSMTSAAAMYVIGGGPALKKAGPDPVGEF